MAIFILFFDYTMLLLFVNANVTHHVSERGALVGENSFLCPSSYNNNNNDNNNNNNSNNDNNNNNNNNNNNKNNASHYSPELA